MTESVEKRPNFIVIADDPAMLHYVNGELALKSIDAAERFATIPEATSRLPPFSDQDWLFIVQVADPSELTKLGTLHLSYPGRPIIAVLGEGWDVQRILEPMRMGAAQIVPLPAETGVLGDAIATALSQFGYVERVSRLIAIIGVHGGCGATTFALNLGAELTTTANRPIDCLLLEKNWTASNFTTYLGLTPQYTMRDIIEHEGEVDADLMRGACLSIAKGLSLVPAPKEGGIAGYRLGRERFRQICQACKQLAEIVIVDMAYMSNPEFLEMMNEFDQHILIANQATASVDALKTVRATIVDNGGKDVINIVNRFDESLHGLSSNRINELFGPDWRPIPDDHSVQVAANGGVLIGAAQPNSLALAAIREIAYSVLGQQPTQSLSLIGRLSGWLSQW